MTEEYEEWDPQSQDAQVWNLSGTFYDNDIEVPDGHVQPHDLDDDEEWVFNDECECDRCIEHHWELENPVQDCTCEACGNSHANLDAPEDGCECEHCVELDNHEQSGFNTTRWPWIFNPQCTCRKCQQVFEDLEFPTPEAEYSSARQNHSEISKPVVGCKCFYCMDLYSHKEPKDGLGRWPWRFNKNCSCRLCIELKSKVETGGQASSNQNEVKKLSVEDLFEIFLKVNVATLRKGAVWSTEEDQYLEAAYFDNQTLDMIAVKLARTKYALVRRLIRNLIECKGHVLKFEEDFEYVLENSPWTREETMACFSLFQTGFGPIGISKTLRRRPLSVAAKLIENPELFRR